MADGANSSSTDGDDLYETTNDEPPMRYSAAEWPDDSKQDDLITMHSTDPEAFKEAITKIIRDNSDKFNVLQLNQNSEEANTSMSKEAFSSTFKDTFKPQLLHLLFDIVDVNSTGQINNAALIAFINNKTKHPRFETTQIDVRWLMNSIKEMNFGQVDTNSDNRVSFDEMKAYFAQKNVGQDIVRLVFDEIVQDQDDKTYISMKTFFQWRDHQFNVSKIRSWSHALSQTVVFNGLQDLLEELKEEDDGFELVENDHQNNDNNTSLKPSAGGDYEHVDTTTNEADLLQDICKVLDLPADDTHRDELSTVIKTCVEKLQYQLADARYEQMQKEQQAKQKEAQLEYQLAEARLDTMEQKRHTQLSTEDAKLMKTEVIKHKVGIQKLSKELSELVGHTVNTDDPNALMDVCRELQMRLSDEIQEKIKAREQTVELKLEIAKLENELGDAKLAMKKLKRELSETLGEHNDDVHDPHSVNELFQRLQFQLAEDKLAVHHGRRASIQLEQKKTELQVLKGEIAKLQDELAASNAAMKRLRKELSETIGEHNADDNQQTVNELFKKLQGQLAEEKEAQRHARRESIALKEKNERIHYELADERIELKQLRDSLQEILDLDLDKIDDLENVKELLLELQELANDGDSSSNTRTKNDAEDDELRKADEKIQKVDMEQELQNIDAEDDNDRDYNDITDVATLRKVIRAMKDELRASRTNHLAVSETKTHLEVQTFDLQTKLSVEKKKYTKLLRASQQMAGFDAKALGLEEKEVDANVHHAHSGGDDDDDDDEDRMAMTVDLSSNNNAGYVSDGGDSVNVNENVEHREHWTGSGEELDAKIKALTDELNQQKQENSSMQQQIRQAQADSEALRSEVDKLRDNNRQHKRRETELFDRIGDDAKNVVLQLEELDDKKRAVEDAELELAHLKAERQRMEIAYEHATTSATELRQQVSTLKETIKVLERKASTVDQVDTLKSKLQELEDKAAKAGDLELELAYFKAEQQRMQIKMEFGQKSYKQAKELNKSLEKEVKSEKEKVRRLSQQINPRDIETLNRLHDDGIIDEQRWKDEVDKLKYQLAEEKMEKLTLAKEKQQLQQRLSNAQSTQKAAKRDEEEEEDESDASEMSGNENGGNEEEDEPEDGGYDEDDDEEQPEGKHIKTEEEKAKIKQEMETLKFKLANAQLQNAELKRRVSIAGVEKEALSLLWEQPRVTIQMVSEFIERLPLKHKEKIWARHATGQYIAKNKILHTLHSFVALCIKIKDRTAVAPSRHDIEKRLLPFADVIRQRTENANGMSLDEFNNELHFWILEPVSGLVMTTDEQKQWMEEIDALREELVKAQKEKMRIQRKSQMDLTVLLDKMKGFEQAAPQEKIEELEAQIEELQTIVNELQDENHDKEQQVKELSAEKSVLNEEIAALRKGRDKARDSEDEEEHEQSQHDDYETAPQLIDESQQKTLSEFRALQTDDEFAEERLEFYQNDRNVTKSSAYIGWKTKAQKAREQIEHLERERKQSVEQVTMLKQTVEKLKKTKEAQETQHEEHVEHFKQEIAKFKKKYQESDKIRKDSISTLHDNLFAKLLEAEAEHEEMVADYKQQISSLTQTNKSYQTTMSAMAQTKIDTVKSLSATIQELRDSVAALSKQVDILMRKNEELEAKPRCNIFRPRLPAGWAEHVV
eukprot:CAMPEP_0197045870 /NCGR_PEP_ID=MMETSP1384-20130603/21656_1 /TAXON_ID=29189 /ORGANISM="Ammonia sp." /LENGTH=1661 /DNA_ID=CAMNT_0042477547 /DNA_START=48 /DNA_END=5034 /DNA_ORIENTATION=-